MDTESFLKTKYDEKRKIWYGPKTKRLYDRDVSLGQVLFNALFSNPKNILEINDTEGVTLTNEDVIKRSIRVALSLRAHGVSQQDVVGILASNSANLMPIAFGSMFLAAPFHALDVSFTKDAIIHSWSKTRPKIVFCDGSAYDMVKEAGEKMGLEYLIYTVNNHMKGVKRVDDILQPQPLENLFRPSEISNGDNTAVILCSSGTTGLSKSVCISHKSFTSLFSNV